MPGSFRAWETLGDQSRFVYDIPYPSGLLFYPMAAYPYVLQETVYQDRVLVGIYSSSADAGSPGRSSSSSRRRSCRFWRA